MLSDTREELISRLLAAHSSLFDVSSDYLFEGRRFPGYAEFHSHGEKYVLVKRAKLWEVSTHEYLFIDAMEHLDEEILLAEIEFMKEKAFRKVAPGPDHMSSAVSLIIVAHSVSDDAARLVNRTRYRKNYRMAFHGWADLRLAVVDLSRPSGTQTFTNPAGRQLRNVLERNVALSHDASERSQS